MAKNFTLLMQKSIHLWKQRKFLGFVTKNLKIFLLQVTDPVAEAEIWCRKVKGWYREGIQRGFWHQLHKAGKPFKNMQILT